MKILVPLLLLVIVLPVFAEPISDKTGLKTTFSVSVNSNSFDIESTANFDVRNVSFEDDTLTFAINSSLENNFGELQIPNAMTSGELQFFLDGTQITPKILKNEKISFVTLEFAGNGTHTLQVKSNYAEPPQIEILKTTDLMVDENPDDAMIILAAVGIVAAGGAATTAAVYLKRKKA